MNLVRGIDFEKLAEKMGGCNGAEVKVILFPYFELIFTGCLY